MAIQITYRGPIGTQGENITTILHNGTALSYADFVAAVVAGCPEPLIAKTQISIREFAADCYELDFDADRGVLDEWQSARISRYLWNLAPDFVNAKTEAELDAMFSDPQFLLQCELDARAAGRANDDMAIGEW